MSNFDQITGNPCIKFNFINFPFASHFTNPHRSVLKQEVRQFATMKQLRARKKK